MDGAAYVQVCEIINDYLLNFVLWKKSVHDNCSRRPMKISRKKSFLNFWVEPPSQSNHSRIVLLQAHSHDVGTTPASFLFVFVLFTFQFKRQIYNFELYQLKKSVDVIVWI